MTVEKIDTLVIGAGQAGVAMSEHLSSLDVPHIVLERNRIAEQWRTARWDSLVANGPAWHDRFPGMEFEGHKPDDFVPKEQVADYLEAYAKKFNAPIRTGVEVKKVTRNTGGPGFIIETSKGVIEANRVVAATGPFQTPVIPPIAKNEKIVQIHSAEYRNPQQLPEGAVLVVGAGSSGVQIADEIQRSGKKVYLSAGPHDRPPRSYRNRDFCWWLGVLGEWDREAMEPGTEHVTIAVTGAHGSHGTVDFRALAHQGITLLGMTKEFKNGKVTFQEDLVENVERGNKNYMDFLDAADAYIERNGIELPEEPEARKVLPDPDCMTNPILELDLAEAGITSIVWATGFALDYSWLDVDAFDEQGKPKHQRGVSSEPGVYFVGQAWLSRRGSAFIWGVWHDAKHIAGHIATQRTYLAYTDPSQR
ncbi:NAD(P)/FAD-dependent oxidoreductase [Dasania marina]|uniref:flavin-containing monooxygenase n=1 Tax=Dasania marina TaxID=471499 RepID=UPI0030D8C63E|tara:strand:+ start:46825 stop:48084 length:1260 start_codon:yes stop_codon:yes gene_type:complete